MASIYDWSTTPGNNASSDAAMPWPEGMAPSVVNDSARQLVGRVAEILGDIGGALSAGGTANGLTVTANSAFTTYDNGRIVSFRATADNTTAATLSVNGIGAKAIRKMDSTGDVALAAGEIQNTGIYIVQYQTALNGGAGAWLLVNPTLSAAIYGLSGLVTVDNTVPRFNGTAGVIQTSGVVIDDSDNLSGMTVRAVSGTEALPSLSFSADTNTGFWQLAANAIGVTCNGIETARFLTTGLTITGAITGTAITGTTGTFSGAVSATTGTFSGAVSATTYLSTSGVFAADDAVTSMSIRPNGVASSTGQLVIANTGNTTINGTLTVTG